MLFKKRFHDGIRDGAITVAYRAWREPRVLAGRRYRSGGLGLLAVDEIDKVSLSSVGDDEAQASGFESLEELHTELRRSTNRRLTRRSKIFRVRFRYEGPVPDEPEREVTGAAVRETETKLEQMDRRSRVGPWTRVALRLIDTHPGEAARTLSPELDREPQAFKADVRKLKNLGLTRSLETGYELTSLGKALLKRDRSED